MELVSSEKPISLLGLQTAVFSLFFTQMVLLLCVCVLRCSSFKNTSHTGFRSTQMTSFYLNYLFKGPIFKNQSYSEVLEIQFSSVQLLSRVQLFVTPWIAAFQASLSITNSWSSLRLNVHWVSDAIQPSHPLSSPSPPAPNPSQHQSFPMSQLFTWGGQSIGISALASFLPKNTQGWSPSEWTGWISLQSKGLSRVFSNTRVQKHQFFGAQLSSQSNSHIHTWPLEKP